MYEPIDDGVVLVGNYVAFKTLGIGTVKIKMHNGIIRTFVEVRHLPNLKKNLISLGTLRCKGCKSAAEGGVLKICRGFFVLMKAKKVGCLYMVEGSTVTSLIAACSSLTVDDTIGMWYMRLGHMSEKGMDASTKRGLFV